MQAKRKYKRRRKQSPQRRYLAQWLYAAGWIAVVGVVLVFALRYIGRQAVMAAEGESGLKIEGLETVVIPEGISNETHAYKGFTTYFNSDCHIPNCVSYELTRQETQGEFPRYKNFETDPNLAGSANPWDYTHSGYDRGHMVPAGDMKWDRDAMRETFYMSNIAPQLKALNVGGWHKLENKVRDWAQRDSALVIVTGPIMGEKMSRIGDGKVAVPPAFFKVILAPFTTPVRAIGFIYKNEECKGGLKYYAVSVDEVERQTGLDFFSALPDEVETRIEAQCDLNSWNERN